MITRRRLLTAGGPLLAGSLAAASCSRAGRRTADSVPAVSDPSAPTEPASPSTEPSSLPTTEAQAPPVTAAATTVTPSTTAEPTAWTGADFGALDEFIAATDGDAFIVVERGATVHEWYRNDASFTRDIASAQKSVLSMLIGRAIADGHIELDTLIDDVLGPDWTPHGQTATITVRHLLSMTSGLDDAFAVVAEPGTAWIYSGAFAQLFYVLEASTGRELNDVAREWLFDPAGAATAAFYERRTVEFAPIGLRATAADLVAIGNVVTDPNHPSHQRGWLDESFVPSQDFNRSYGYLWWLNGQKSFLLPGQARAATDGSLIPTAPVDLVAALGKDDQKLYVSRELDLIVARLGGKARNRSSAALSSFDAELWSMLLALRG